ncbi:DMT family transporter [Faecalispora anaeroviscerum]|uniref:DMT family transporter n=1 Tax=Faecalispora anaeroviscerum TaxID=2991836 RepID=UPI0024B92710|nr:multidrug efflux SMR transporter [Faecalispora anaeroviscerum]
MQWVFLLVAGLFEVVWAVGLKMSENFSKLAPSAVTIVGLIASMYFLSLSLKELPIGTAYAIWTGIGTAGTLIFSVVWFREAITLPQVLCVMMIIGGVVGLKVLSPS